jgi:hypothetical protein
VVTNTVALNAGATLPHPSLEHALIVDLNFTFHTVALLIIVFVLYWFDSLHQETKAHHVLVDVAFWASFVATADEVSA